MGLLKMNDTQTIILGDCLAVMRGFKDNQFDLIITDPPYGIGVDQTMHKQSGTIYGKAAARKSNYPDTSWDSAPPREVFEEMFRVSKNQVIFGGNYFTEYLKPGPCWIVWDKVNGTNGFADCELAWTSFKSAVRMYKYMWNGMLQGDMKNKELRYHPTQKPTRLMKWIIANYAKEGQTILDPFAGSGSTLRAAKDLHYDCTGIEIYQPYVDIINKRLAQGVLL